MLDFAALRSKKKTIADLVTGLGINDLRELTNEMVDRMQEIIKPCSDADVVFVPIDPMANDPHAINPDEVKMAWTLGHVIVHAAASTEEACALAAEMARGVMLHGRSRYETPWQEATTIAFCITRLEENRRMRLASLGMWPDQPHLEYIIEPWPGMTHVNAIGRFALGLMHDEMHLEHMVEIIRQAKAKG
jgi:hypothetical protein